MIVIPASLRSDFIHMAGMTIHIALESTIHIVGIRSYERYRLISAIEIHQLQNIQAFSVGHAVTHFGDNPEMTDRHNRTRGDHWQK